MPTETTIANANRTPVTIITGYLGSGKTTLLQHILANSNKKFAILMNEFGEFAIDAKIIEGKNVKIAELAGGCVCCSLSGEFELAVKEILEKVKPEWIIVETTGVAEPTAIVFDVEESIPEIRLDAILTLVDADAFNRFPNLGHTGKEQIEMADIIILNKIDLVDEKQMANAEERLHKINGRAILAKAIKSKVPPAFIFGLSKDQKSKLQKHEPHKIDTEVFLYESDGIFSKEQFLQLAASLPKEIYRSKGFIKCSNHEYYSFNFVAGRFDLEPFASEKTELVFLGKNILKLEKEIKERLEMCKVK